MSAEPRPRGSLAGEAKSRSHGATGQCDEHAEVEKHGNRTLTHTAIQCVCVLLTSHRAVVEGSQVPLTLCPEEGSKYQNTTTPTPLRIRSTR